MITLQIDIENTGVLDGLSLLDINAPGVEVIVAENRSYLVSVPANIPFGRLNFGDVIPAISGRPVLVSGITVVSSLPYAGFGNALQRVTPIINTQEATQQIADLSAIGGMAFFSCPEIFPLDHLLAVTTNVPGPHRIIVVLKVLSDDDVAKLGAGCAGGGGASTLVTQENGVPIVPLTGVNNFIGAGVGVTQSPFGTALIDIPGGALPPTQSVQFLDSATVDIIVGSSLTDGAIMVDACISDNTGRSSGYRFTFGVSATAAGLDCVQAPAVSPPILDIIPTALLVGTNVVLRLIGTGPGIPSDITYRIVDQIARFF